MSRGYQRELKEMAHWALIRHRQPFTQNDRTDDSGFVSMQALSCPYYVPLTGEWSSDWGAIVHPRSEKFGQLVFEHEWCGCTYHPEGRET